MQKSSISKILIVEVEFQDDTHKNKSSLFIYLCPFYTKSLPQKLLLEHIKELQINTDKDSQAHRE